MKSLLFSVTKKDFEMQTFKASGPGGQKRNKTNSAVRLIHRESGAVAEAKDSRSQHQNKLAAFEKLIASDKFQAWLRTETAQRSGALRDVEERVDRMMRPENLKIEMF